MRMPHQREIIKSFISFPLISFLILAVCKIKGFFIIVIVFENYSLLGFFGDVGGAHFGSGKRSVVLSRSRLPHNIAESSFHDQTSNQSIYGVNWKFLGMHSMRPARQQLFLISDCYKLQIFTFFLPHFLSLTLNAAKL